MCPRNSGIWSGTLPLSFRGMTANAPPPPDSQLTDRYSGLTLTIEEETSAFGFDETREGFEEGCRRCSSSLT